MPKRPSSAGGWQRARQSNVSDGDSPPAKQSGASRLSLGSTVRTVLWERTVTGPACTAGDSLSRKRVALQRP
jgi:hypothetical protein